MSTFVSSWTASVLLSLAGFERAESRGERFLRLAAEARSRITEIPPVEFALVAKKGITVIDVREKEEFQRGHIPGAVNLPRGTIEFELEKRAADPGTEILVYCGAGNRSALAADNLQRMGYAHVRSLAGGFRAWLDAGYPASRSAHGFVD